MANLNLFGSILSFAFIWLIALLYPPLHKILRNKKTYFGLLFFSILLTFSSIFFYEDDIFHNKTHTLQLSSCLLFFLILYKICDNVILKKYDRHMYFSIKYNSIWNDDESDHTQMLDGLFQFLLSIVPLILSWGFGSLLLKIIL